MRHHLAVPLSLKRVTAGLGRKFKTRKASPSTSDPTSSEPSAKFEPKVYTALRVYSIVCRREQWRRVEWGVMSVCEAGARTDRWHQTSAECSTKFLSPALMCHVYTCWQLELRLLLSLSHPTHPTSNPQHLYAPAIQIHFPLNALHC